MALFPSEAWVKEYVDKINASKEYEEAAATWEGDLCYVFEAEPDKGVPADVWAWADLWHGKCRGSKYDVAAEEGEKAKFIIRAPYSRWKQVINKELDPIKGMMQGKLKLKGDLPTIVRYVKAAMTALGHNNVIFPTGPLIVLGPEHARVLARDGYDKASIRQYLFRRARIPLSRFGERTVRGLKHRRARWFAEADDPDHIGVADHPSHITIVVAGGAGIHSQFVPTSFSYGPVTRPIRF